jgi:hypothetical protein
MISGSLILGPLSHQVAREAAHSGLGQARDAKAGAGEQPLSLR